MRRGAGASPATALIAAAGSGNRLGAEQPKALVEVAGRPMLEWSLLAFAEASAVGPTIVAAPPTELERFTKATASFDARIVAGADTRSRSVAAALEHADTELVAVHDAARPLVTPELIAELIDELAGHPDAGGVIAAAPVTDTVKRARGQRVERTESRRHLWAAQTPQVFRTAALREAIGAGADRLAEATDDAWLVEQAGGEVLIHSTTADNLKVTTPFELRLAELLLADRRG